MSVASGGASASSDSSRRCDIPETHDSRPFVWHRGPLIVSCESLFWHLQRYPGRRVARARPPLTERAFPRELEQPFRQGHARTLRLPLTRRALVVGYWEPESGEPILAEEEQEHLLAAVEGAHLDGITATEIADWARARDVVSQWRQLVARWRAWRAKQVYRAAQRPDPWPDDELDGWEADEGWSVRPWDGGPDGGPVFDLEDARVQP
jgi:hypothetical protein